MKYTLKKYQRVYVVVNEVKIEEGVLLSNSGQWLHVRTNSGEEVKGYYGKLIFLTQEKAEKVLQKITDKKEHEALLKATSKLAYERTRNLDVKMSKCDMCGKVSPLYNRQCECKPYIR